MLANDLFAASTYFCPEKSAPLGQATYISKSGGTKPSQIDYVLVSRKWLSSIRSSKVVWAQTIARHLRRFDHGMIKAVLHLRIPAQKPKKSFPDRAWLCDKKNAPAFNEAYAQARTAEPADRVTLSQEFKGITCFLRSALKSVPSVTRSKSAKRTSSQRTLDLIAARASVLHGIKPGTDDF